MLFAGAAVYLNLVEHPARMGCSTEVAAKEQLRCELLPELGHFHADPVIVKKRYSAFFGTDLDARLSKIRPDVLVIAGEFGR